MVLVASAKRKAQVGGALKAVVRVRAVVAAHGQRSNLSRRPDLGHRPVVHTPSCQPMISTPQVPLAAAKAAASPAVLEEVVAAVEGALAEAAVQPTEGCAAAGCEHGACAHSVCRRAAASAADNARPDCGWGARGRRCVAEGVGQSVTPVDAWRYRAGWAG